MTEMIKVELYVINCNNKQLDNGEIEILLKQEAFEDCVVKMKRIERANIGEYDDYHELNYTDATKEMHEKYFAKETPKEITEIPILDRWDIDTDRPAGQSPMFQVVDGIWVPYSSVTTKEDAIIKELNTILELTKSFGVNGATQSRLATLINDIKRGRN